MKNSSDSSHHLQGLDYIIFILMLCISTGIGIFFGCFGKKLEANSVFVVDRSMGSIPVSMSLFASFISSATILGTPLEVYNSGIMFMWSIVGFAISCIITCQVFVPLFIRLGYTSAYEYLEKRFDKKVKYLATAIFITQTLLYLAFVLYGPAVAIHTATKMNLWVLVITIGVISTFYTTVGGMVTVMWTDVFQVLVICFGIVLILMVGLNKSGGLSRVIETNWSYNRIHLFNLDIYPNSRHTILSLTLGYGFQWLGIFGANQSQIQRYMCASSLKVAKRAVYINLAIYSFVVMILLLIGMNIFAVNDGCDILGNRDGEILFPEFVMNELYDLNGLPGVFLALLFAASLSSISSGLNSLTAVTLESILKGLFKMEFNEKKCIQMSMILSILYGILVLSLTYIPHLLKDTLQAVLSLFSITCGPILGMFIVGFFFPFTNSNGAFFGGLLSFIFSVFIYINFYVFESNLIKNIFNQNCSCTLKNTTSNDYTILNITYEWYGFIAVLIVIIFGSVISCFTKPIKLNLIQRDYVHPKSFDLYSKLCNKIRIGILGFNQCQTIDEN
ncbi:sodium-coupled monocarboxylate transporter 1-like [Brachionus plicatilis]|uniref:Sodium-coupled monocarboxylate transporter 1-like n=1 Tax=Brachionus plicatilis TaxID=10195 RepID=A0A3M7QUY4_BRAPC|nr:sodium-coupled monocarboxylate transporter 1-like [Brachionus plicatilis]